MENLLFCITKTDADDVSSSLKDNGLLEIVLPKEKGDEDINAYFEKVGADHIKEISKVQKKATNTFRKKVKTMIDKSREEFGLPFLIELRFVTGKRRTSDHRLNLYGIKFTGCISMMTALQYSPDDIVEKIVRYEVYKIACEYEELWSQIRSLSIGSVDFTTRKTIRESSSEIPEEKKYHITVQDSEIAKIISDFYDADKAFVKGLNNKQIYRLRLKA